MAPCGPACPTCRPVVQTLRDNLPGMFPDRELDDHGQLRHIPKTLIFAKDDSYAEDIVRIAREELGRGNDVIAKITYKASEVGGPDELILSPTGPSDRISGAPTASTGGQG